MPESAPGSAVFAPIGSSALVDQVRGRLQDAIALGILAPGERLPSEAALASRFQVSMVTVREALQQLRVTGFVMTRRGRGGGSFVDIDVGRAEELMRQRVRGLSRAELVDYGTYFLAIAEAVLRRIAGQGVAGEAETMVGRFASAMSVHSGGEARVAQGSLDLRLAGLSQSVRLVREQIAIQNEFAPLLWMCMNEHEARVNLGRLHREMLIRLADEDVEGAIAQRRTAVGTAVRWLLDVRNHEEA
ncbi:GntR family transcriptional regulator [Brevibacterium sp. 5221]|uniref:GntR family transcriptional regulator n=1 Tax=Brevibacterium rongguiense TaxID=2695267 RepID=A0A6N9H4Z1_9MICO|nr:winged helix-turn-helix domain-containing protein [Brevibacterium rongguiense]MYM18846.1 GntR family transcriptional regulator [Brevibacterium rongguiense]